MNSNKNECAPTESIKMSLNVTQDVPQDVTQGVPQQHVLYRYDQHIIVIIQ